MRATLSVFKAISLPPSQLKTRQLLFVTRHGNRNITIPVGRQFHTSNTHWQQQAPKGQQQASHQNEFQSAMLYQLINRLKYRWATALGKIIFAIVVAFLGWLFDVWAKFYFVYSELTTSKRVAKAFEEASEREKDKKIETGKYVNRTKVEDELLKLFELENNYALIYGEHGVGKTTSVKYVVKKAREQGIPVLYFPVETQEGVNFVESFAAALKGFDVVPKTAPLEWRDLLKIYLGFTKDAPTSVKSLFPTLVKAGKILTKKTGKRPVLVIDACNNLEKEPGGLSILENLQDFAKEQADKNEILVIFVSSEGKAPQTLLTRSAASRMRRYRIEELDREEADTYLQKVMNIKNKETRAKILDITGYTFNYLNLANYDVKSIEQEVATSIKGNLKAVGLVGWDTDDKIVKVVQEILNHGRITYKEYFNIIGDREKAEKILQGNVFTTKEIGVETVIYFQNTATRNFFARSLKMMETTK